MILFKSAEIISLNGISINKLSGWTFIFDELVEIVDTKRMKIILIIIIIIISILQTLIFI